MTASTTLHTAQSTASTSLKISDSQSPLFQRQCFYKPFRYPWAYEAWLTQQRLHWLAGEVTMSDDIKDWNVMAENEKNLLTQIFRFFTQSDVEVNNCYMKYYSQIFQPIEVQMMLAAFSNIETIHIDGYAYLLDTIGMPEVEYQKFLNYKAMKDKWDYMQDFGGDTVEDVALTLALFAAFTEGLQLFASFVILMNFPRFNKMKGMGQIVSWSVRDETLHTHSMIRLYHTILQEHPSLCRDNLKEKIRMICQTVVEHEDAFVDLAFEMGEVEGLTAQTTKDYVRYIANRRLVQLHVDPIFSIKENPCPWMNVLTGVEHSNFFEVRGTEYSKGATAGSWDDVFAEVVG